MIFPFLIACGLLSVGLDCGMSAGQWSVNWSEYLFEEMYDAVDEAVEYIEQLSIEVYDDIVKGLEEAWKTIEDGAENALYDMENDFEKFAKKH